jgi:hypothetical protein
MIPGCCAVPLLSVSVYALGIFLCRYVRDGVCFSAARGTVGKDGGIVAVEYTVKKGFCGGLVDFGLGCVVVKDSIEGKGLILGSLSAHAWSQTSLGARVFWIEDSEKVVSTLGNRVPDFGHTSISHP